MIDFILRIHQINCDYLDIEWKKWFKISEFISKIFQMIISWLQNCRFGWTNAETEWSHLNNYVVLQILDFETSEVTLDPLVSSFWDLFRSIRLLTIEDASYSRTLDIESTFSAQFMILLFPSPPPSSLQDPHGHLSKDFLSSPFRDTNRPFQDPKNYKDFGPFQNEIRTWIIRV